jgi:hypothetical protein
MSLKRISLYFQANLSINSPEDLCTQINNELKNIARRDKTSVLRDRGYHGLKATSFDGINNEIRTSCPLVHQVLSAMIELQVDSQSLAVEGY